MKKFNQIWTNQTKLGEKFGLSAIAIGKLLIEHGLKDSQTKLATSKAIDEEYAKATPLKDGTLYFMWNIDKVYKLINEKHEALSPIDYWVNHVKKIMQEAEKEVDEGNKLGYMLADSAYDEVPKNLKEEVRIKTKIFSLYED